MTGFRYGAVPGAALWRVPAIRLAPMRGYAMKAKGVLIVSDDERSLLGDARPIRVSGDAPTIKEDQRRAVLFAAADQLLEGLKCAVHELTAPRTQLRGFDEERWQRLIAATEAGWNVPAPSGWALDGQEIATILAALRYYQQNGQGDPKNRSDEIHEIATDGDTEISMDDAGIDELCESLNCADEVALQGGAS